MSGLYCIVECEGTEELFDQAYRKNSVEDDVAKAKAFARKVFPQAAKRAAKKGIKKFSLVVMEDMSGHIYLRLKGKG